MIEVLVSWSTNAIVNSLVIVPRKSSDLNTKTKEFEKKWEVEFEKEIVVRIGDFILFCGNFAHPRIFNVPAIISVQKGKNISLKTL
jgi:hypothetical protein